MSQPKVLGGVDLSAATAADVFSSSANGDTFAVIICNRNTSTATIKLGLSTTSATFANATYLEYNTKVAAESSIHITGLCIENTYYLVAESDLSSVNVVAVGWEKA